VSYYFVLNVLSLSPFSPSQLFDGHEQAI